jgi:hypothetical protein
MLTVLLPANFVNLAHVNKDRGVPALRVPQNLLSINVMLVTHSSFCTRCVLFLLFSMLAPSPPHGRHGLVAMAQQMHGISYTHQFACFSSSDEEDALKASARRGSTSHTSTHSPELFLQRYQQREGLDRFLRRAAPEAKGGRGTSTMSRQPRTTPANTTQT